MPSTAKNSTAGKSKSNTGNTASGGKSASNKKQGAVNLKPTSARDKAKNFDEGRRSDANSNEL